MEIALGKLQSGDKFWSCYVDEIVQFEVIGEVNYLTCRMPSYKVKVISEHCHNHTMNKPICETVYDNYEDAKDNAIDKLRREISSLTLEISDKNKYLNILMDRMRAIENQKH